MDFIASEENKYKNNLTSEKCETKSEIPFESLKSRNPKSVIFSYINVNSIRYKLGDLNKIVGNLVDILCIAETKLENFKAL